jgi:universal stress protein E
MQGFRNVLFVSEGNPAEQVALLHLAQDLHAAGGKLTLVDVVQDVPAGHAAIPVRGGLERLQKAIVKERLAALQQQVQELQQQLPGLKARCLVREGNDCIEVIRQAVKGKHDLVAKAATNSSRVEGLLFGTLDMALLRKCPVPVLILKGRKKIRHRRVLAAVQLVHDAPEREQLDRQVVELAASVARASEGQLDLLHAWFLHFEKVLRSDAVNQEFGTVDTMLQELRANAKASLATIAADYADLDPALHLIKGRPQEVIPRFVRNHRIQLVVMGTVGRTGIAGLFIGNTAEKILQNLSCSVLAIKPAGFRSPVV